MNTTNNRIINLIQHIIESDSKNNSSNNYSAKSKKSIVFYSDQYLTDIELSSLYLKTIRKYKLHAIKDILVFSCYTGLKPEEIMKLRKSNIKVLIDGSKVIEVKKENGMPNFLIPITRKMESIIHYYNGYHKLARGGKLFPTYSMEEINEALTYLSAFSRVYKPLTFLLARRTYLVHEFLNGTSLETLQINLGHKKTKSTREYINLQMQEIFGVSKSYSSFEKSSNHGK